VHGVPKLIDFLKNVFVATEVERMTQPDGTVRHAEVKIGDSIVMMGEAGEQWKAMPAMLYVYVKDVDATYKKALAAGATSVREPADQFYGDRSCGVQDASGNQWWISTHIEDVAPEEMQKRAKAAAQQTTAAKSS
jgi:PhnB protein